MRSEVIASFVVVFITLTLFLPSVPSQTARAERTEASEEVQGQAGDYIVLRTQVKTLYIVDQEMPIKVMCLVYQDGDPTENEATIHVNINRVGADESHQKTYKSGGGDKKTHYLPGLDEGRYSIRIYAAFEDVKSREKEEEFGVKKPPIPYDLKFTRDGSEIHFVSKKLNETGHPDPKLNFTIKLFHYEHGQGESRLKVYKEVVKLDIDVKDIWQRGILIVDVYGPHGWTNSENMNLDNMEFRGRSTSYDYEREEREPYRSMGLNTGIISAVAIIVLMIVATIIHSKFTEVEEVKRGGRYG